MTTAFIKTTSRILSRMSDDPAPSPDETAIAVDGDQIWMEAGKWRWNGETWEPGTSVFNPVSGELEWTPAGA